MAEYRRRLRFVHVQPVGNVQIIGFGRRSGTLEMDRQLDIGTRIAACVVEHGQHPIHTGRIETEAHSVLARRRLWPDRYRHEVDDALASHGDVIVIETITDQADYISESIQGLIQEGLLSPGVVLATAIAFL